MSNENQGWLEISTSHFPPFTWCVADKPIPQTNEIHPLVGSPLSSTRWEKYLTGTCFSEFERPVEYSKIYYISTGYAT